MTKHGVGRLLLATIVAVLVAVGCAGSAVPAPTTERAATAEKARQPGAGSQDRWQQTVAAARKEGKVTIYGELGSEAKAGMNKFKERFGIEVDTIVGSGPEVAARYVQESRNGIYLADILFNGSPTFLSTIKPNVPLAQVSPNLLLPEVTDPKVWPEGRIPFLDKDQLIVQSTLGRIFFAIVNTDLVKEGEITSFQDYLNPKWKEKIVMFDPTIAGSASTWMSVFLTELYGQDEGRKYLTRLAQQEPLILRDKRLPVEWVARGKYAIHIGPNMQTSEEFVRAGAPVKAIREKELTFLNPSSSNFALPAKSPHPNAAIVMVNWLLTAEGGAVLSRAWGAPASRLDVPTTGVNPMNVALPGEKVYLNNEELVLFSPKSREIAREIFGHLIK